MLFPALILHVTHALCLLMYVLNGRIWLLYPLMLSRDSLGHQTCN